MSTDIRQVKRKAFYALAVVTGSIVTFIVGSVFHKAGLNPILGISPANAEVIDPNTCTTSETCATCEACNTSES